MSKLYDAVHTAIGRGARTTDEIVGECSRMGLPYRPETVELFLRLSHEAVERDGAWSRTGRSKQDRVVAGLQKAFASGQTYMPMDRLSRFLDEGEPVTVDDIVTACATTGAFRVKGNLILRVQ
jgi:hypothetical protein